MSSGSVIIVSHNSAECIELCLRSVTASQQWKVILVDNASADQTVAKAKSLGFDISIVANSHNCGFAGAVNQGVKLAAGNIFVILNPDAVPDPGALEKLARALASEPIGAAGGVLLNSDRKPEKGFTVRRFPTLGSMLAEILLFNRIWERNPWNRWYRCLDLDYSQGQEVEQPAGACLAVKRRAWEEIGGFDESFFPVWFDDVDFCRRLHDREWKICYVPEAAFIHLGGHSVGKLSFRARQSHWYRNLLHYFGKHHSWWAVICLRLGMIAGLLLRSVLSLVGAGPAGISVREALAGYCHVMWEYAVAGRGLQLNRKASPIASPAV